MLCKKCNETLSEEDLLLAIKKTARDYLDDTGAEHNWYDYQPSYRALMLAVEAYEAMKENEEVT